LSQAFRQLQRFYDRANRDSRLLPSHISLYFGLIWLWSINEFSPKLKIARKELMALSHINSIVTYHKCIKDLTDFGYFEYRPSFNSYKGSEIRLLL